MNQLDENNKNGCWEVHYDNGKLACKGNYVNGIKEGYWEYYNSKGDLRYCGNYVKGNLYGYWKYYSDEDLDSIEFYIHE